MKLSFHDFVKMFSLVAGQTGKNTVGVFVKGFLDDNKVPYTEDKYGNIYNITMPNTPLFCSHMDTVRETGGSPSPLKVEGFEYISSPGHVLGGDDINGVFILLNLIVERNINFLFTMDEETVYRATSKKFITKKENFHLMRENVPYFVCLDRKGNNDIIVQGAYNRYGSEEFQKQICLFGSLNGYFLNNGIMCDADYLIHSGVSGCNISVGYYNAHSNKEYVRWTDVLKAYLFTKNLVDNFKFHEELPEIEPPKKKSLGDKKGSRKIRIENVIYTVNSNNEIIDWFEVKATPAVVVETPTNIVVGGLSDLPGVEDGWDVP